MSERQDIRAQLQSFTEKLNREPNPAEIEKTPDGRANSLPISFVEMTLDELFFGQWGTRNYTTKLISNEVVGELELYVVHPVSGIEITRVGSAAIIIQVDKAPDDITGKERNSWALDVMNKKPNALDLGYPKLKAECVKNAAQSLGKIFGRDINRKKQDQFKRTLTPIPDAALQAALARIEKGEPGVLELCEANFLIGDIEREMLKNAIPKQINGRTGS